MKNRLMQLLAANRSAPGRRFAVEAQADEVTVYLYDAIVGTQDEADWWGGVAADAFVKEIRASKASTIHLRVNSPGGDVFAARAMEQALRDSKARIVVHIDGVAASAASFLAMAADEIRIAPGAMMMIHQAWTLAFGNADDLISTAALLEKIDTTIADTYAKRAGKDAAEFADAMAAETWYTAQEAVDAGLADVIAEGAKAQAGWDLSAYAKAPPPATKEPDNEQQTEPASVLDASMRAQLSGRLDLALLAH